MSEIIDRLNLWHYEDDDDREEGAGLFENGMEKNEGKFLLNIVTYKPQTMDDVQEICDRFLDGDAVILSLEQADGKSACIFFRNFSRRFPKVRRYRCGSASAEKRENCRKQWDQKSGLTGIIASSYGLDILTARSFTATGQGGISELFIHVPGCPAGKIRSGRL